MDGEFVFSVKLLFTESKSENQLRIFVIILSNIIMTLHPSSYQDIGKFPTTL